MLYLILAIITSTLLTVNFKVYGRIGVNTFQAIVINYITCLIISFIIIGDWEQITSIVDRRWFWLSFGLGSTFIFAFNILARTVQHIGITVTSIFQKMSMILTIVLAFIIFSESTHWLKIVGIILALLSILLTYEKSGKSNLPPISNRHYILAFGVFIISGIIDYCFYYVKKVNLVTNDDMLFTGTTFGVAAIWGVLILLHSIFKKNTRISSKTIIGGISLGIPNVFSVYFILKSLDSGLEGSILFPILNVGVLICSALIGLLIFKEDVNARRGLALSLAFIAILLIGYSTYV